MFLADAATKRPVAMGALLLALVSLGLDSYRKLSLENLPSVDVPYVTVTTVWPGASPEDIERDVAKRIEDAVSGVEGLKHTYSTCLENAGNTMVEFALGTDVDVAAQDVREKIDAILADLPAGAEKPAIAKLDLNASAICTMFLGGDRSAQDLYWLADTKVRDRFASVKGVADVQLVGGAPREIWVELDRDRLASAGLSASDVAQTLGGALLAVPGGRVRDAGSELSVRFDADARSVGEIAALQVAGADGARRHLSDLGSVRVASEEVRQLAFLDGEPGVAIRVVKKSDGNTVETVEALRKRFEALRAELPAGVALRWLTDDGAIVQANVDNTSADIVSSILFCASILFAFLLNARTTFVVAVTMPITIAISLFFMRLSGLSLNLSTLLAIGLSAGILVSNSIVVLENVVRRFETEPDRWKAAREGAAEETVAILASAGTNVVVMLPIAMMTSLVGKFFVPFALTTLYVNAASIFISFTLTPMLCALWLRPASESRGRLARAGAAWDRAIARAGERYGAWLRRVAERRLLAGALLALFALLFCATLGAGTRGLGFLLIENDDWDRCNVRLEFPVSWNLARTADACRRIGADIAARPDVRHVLATPGRADSLAGQANSGVYLAQIEIVLAPAAERARSAEDFAAALRADLARVPDLISTVTIPGYVAGVSSTIQGLVKGPDPDALDEAARRLERLARSMPGFAQVDTTARDGKPEVRFRPRRAVLADLGVPPSALGVALRADVDGLEAGQYKRGEKSVDVRVKLAERDGAGQLAALPLPGAPGRPIPLESLAEEERARQHILLFRHDKERAVLVLGNERQGYAAGAVMDELRERGAREGALGPGQSFGGVGTSEMLDESVADFGGAIVLAALLTYLALAAILESFTLPFLVLSTLPMGLVGVVWALKAWRLNVSIFVLLGVVLLIGVVVNAAVLIVDKSSQLRAAGEAPRDAMQHAVARTFRAVLMVVAASGLGMLPIALSTGIGAANRIGIGAASVGGILVAGALTLTILPIGYIAFCRRTSRNLPARR